MVSSYTFLSYLYPAEASYNMYGYNHEDADWVTRYPAWEGEYTVSIVNNGLSEGEYLDYKRDVVWSLRYWGMKKDLSFKVVQEDDSDIVILLSKELNDDLLKRYISLPDRILAIGYAIPMEGLVEVKTTRSVGPFEYEFGHEKVKDISRHEVGHILGYSHDELAEMGID